MSDFAGGDKTGNQIHGFGSSAQAPDSSAANGITVDARIVAVQPSIYLFQEPYYLSEVEYERIAAGQPLAVSIFVNILLTAVGSTLTVAGQAVSRLVTGQATSLDLPSIYTALLTGLLAAVAWFGARKLPGNYNRTMKAIKNHFKSNPVRRTGGVQ
ncbi:hypothetical protein AB4Y42_02115 [Paraburkholderia sp. EG286B]|uniref:hypothetical protein n=1 Tax=Paraburkholderia sp. EG286B TaxID=3237011 RepID=UPI0034D17690